MEKKGEPMALPILSCQDQYSSYTFRPIKECSEEEIHIYIPSLDPSGCHLSYALAGSSHSTSEQVKTSFVEDMLQLRASERKQLFFKIAAVISGVAAIAYGILKKSVNPVPVAALLGSVVAAQYFDWQARKNRFDIIQRAILHSSHKRNGIWHCYYNISFWNSEVFFRSFSRKR